MRAYLLFLLFIACVDTLAKSGSDTTVSLQNMSIRKWGGESGLLSNNITSAHQARDGYIWLTTYSGIFKFDGYESVVYDNTNLSFISSNGFRKVYEAPDEDILYFASQGSGILTYQNETFSPLKSSNEEIPHSIGSLLIEKDGLIWIGSNNDGLYKMHRNEIEKVGGDIMSGISVLDIFRDEKGNIWIGTEGDGVFIIRNNGKIDHLTVDDGLTSNTINTIIASDEGMLLGTLNGLTQISENQITPLKILSSMSINYLLKKGAYIWIASDNGLGRLHVKNKQFDFLTNYEKGTITRVNWLNFDHEESLWLSTGRDGLLQMRETAIINYTRFDGLSTNKINIVTKDPTGNGFFIGCDDGNIFQLKKDTLQQVNLKTDISPTGIRDILKEEDGTLWIGSYQGLLRKRGAEEKLYGLDDGLPSLDVRRILKDQNKNMWLATRSGGLIKIRNGEVIKVIDKENGLKSNFILAIEELDDGIVVGTHSGGMSFIKENDEIVSYNLTKNDNGIIIFNIHSNDHGLWLVTNIGLFLFKENKFTPLQFKTDYSAISFFDWLEDDNGNAYITSSRGIINIAKDEISLFLSDPSNKLESRVIDESNGMIASECTGATRSLSAEGKLYIPTIGGVAVIDWSRLTINSKPPKVYVESLMADNKIYRSNDSNIPPGANRFVIDFTALSFISPDKMRFKYKLQNFDKEYLETRNTRHTEYTNLSPGDYTFHLLASNNDGIWNETGASFHFKVKPFFYQTIWFIVLMILIFLLSIYGIFRWRLNSIRKVNAKLRKVNSELDSFVYSASHDLRSPLTSLLGLIELSKKDVANRDNYLVKMETSVKKLDSFIADIIDFSSNERKGVTIEEVNFKTLVQQVLDELEFISADDNIDTIVSVKQKKPFYSDRRRIAIILRNLISNAYKYHHPSKKNPYVKVTVKTGKNGASLIVEDNGIGIAKEHQQQVFKMFFRASELSSGSGLGLYIVKETVEKLNGKIDLKSDQKEGTIFTVTLPDNSEDQ